MQMALMDRSSHVSTQPRFEPAAAKYLEFRQIAQQDLLRLAPLMHTVLKEPHANWIDDFEGRTLPLRSGVRLIERPSALKPRRWLGHHARVPVLHRVDAGHGANEEDGCYHQGCGRS